MERKFYYIFGMIIVMIMSTIFFMTYFRCPSTTTIVDYIVDYNVDYNHPNMFLNNSEISFIKQKIANGEKPWIDAYDDMIKSSKVWMNMPNQSVVYSGRMTYSNDIHDYQTDNPYLTDGKPNPNSDRTDYSATTNMSRAVRDLGITYALTGNEKYAEKAVQLINAWTVDPETRMNPKFTNDQSRIELSVSIPSMFYGADLLWNYPGWSKEDKDAFKSWSRQISESAKNWSRNNNYENWRLVFIISASVVTEDIEIRQYVINRWKEIIPLQMNLDGSMKQELTRTNSLTYSTYAVSAMVQTAEIARHHGEDLYNYKLPDNRGLEKTLDFHASYIIDPSKWKYEQISEYKGDNSAIYELAYSFRQKESYSGVISKWKRPMTERRIMGPVTLTHGR